jgi:hypothetical protein
MTAAAKRDRPAVVETRASHRIGAAAALVAASAAQAIGVAALVVDSVARVAVEVAAAAPAARVVVVVAVEAVRVAEVDADEQHISTTPFSNGGKADVATHGPERRK